MLTRRLTSILLLPFALALVGADGSCSLTANEVGGGTTTTTPTNTTTTTTPSGPSGVVGAPSGATVTITPAVVHLPKGGRFHFAAAVTVHADTAVAWSIHPSTPGGVFSDPQTGEFTAPQMAGEYWIVATAVGGANETTQASGVAKVIVDDVFIAISPRAAIVQPGGKLQMTATVVGANDPRVVWSIQEGSPSAGTINAAGLYRAPMGAGLTLPLTVNVRATSIANPNERATATVTVSIDNPMSLRLCPGVTTIVTGETLEFTAAVTPTPGVPGVDWAIVPIGNNWTGGSRIDPMTEYTGRLRAGPDAGTFMVRATAKADPSKFVEGTVTIVNKADRVVRGAVNYTGSLSGPTYVFGPESTTFLPTSTDTAPTLFLLRGETPTTNARTVFACRDTLGTGKCIYAADPMGMATIPEGQSNSDAFVNVTLIDPPSTNTLGPGVIHSVTIIDGSTAIVRFKPLIGVEGTWPGVELADKYDVMIDDTSDMSSPIKTQTVKAGLRPIAIFPGLTAGTYYFAVANKRGSYTGPKTSPAVDRTVAAGTGGHDVSGALDLTGLSLSAASKAYVLAVPDRPDSSGSFGFGDVVTTPLTAASGEPFSISNVASGTYRLEVLVDVDGNGILDGDTSQSDPWGPSTKYVTVADASLPNISLAVESADLLVRATSYVDEQGANHLRVSASSNIKRVVAASVTAGPAGTASLVPVPSNLRLPTEASNEQHPDESTTVGGRLRRSFRLGGTAVPTGDAFGYTVNHTFADGVTCASAVSASRVQAPPSNLRVIAGTPLTYQWTAPPQVSHYRIRVTNMSNDSLVTGRFLAGTATTFAQDLSLIAATEYEVELVAYDAFGNSARATIRFTTP